MPPTTRSPDSSPTEWGSYIVSLTFWSVLLLDAVLFGVLSLSPRLVEWSELRTRFNANARRAEILEAEIKHLRRVEWALENDPDFLERVAGHDFDAHRTGGRQIPVSKSLGFDPRVPATHPAPIPPSEAWWTPLVRSIAAQGPLRQRLTWLTVAICLFAFLCLNDAFGNGALGRFAQRVTQRILRRYTPQSVAGGSDPDGPGACFRSETAVE